MRCTSAEKGNGDPLLGVCFDGETVEPLMLLRTGYIESIQIYIPTCSCVITLYWI